MCLSSKASESMQYMRHFLHLTEQKCGRLCSAASWQVLSPCWFDILHSSPCFLTSMAAHLQAAQSMPLVPHCAPDSQEPLPQKHYLSEQTETVCRLASLL